MKLYNIVGLMMSWLVVVSKLCINKTKKSKQEKLICVYKEF
jgi:hypothetical protein